ncbi:MAG: TOBE domain-containing protein [Acidobacteria bacterium]|nr:TOBE domain-containing protein [Acidobacteriota bacterium]
MHLFLDQITCRNEGSDRPVIDGVSLCVRSGDVVSVVAHPPLAASALLRFIVRSSVRDGVLIGSDGTVATGENEPVNRRDWRFMEPSVPPRWTTESWRGVDLQRFAFPSRANGESPDLLLVDDLAELPAFAETSTRRAFVQDLHALHPVPRRRTILYATRDTDDALAVADRVAVMQSGRLVQFGTPAEVYDAPETEFVAELFGQPPINLFPAILEKDGQALNLRNQSVALGGRIAEEFCRDVTGGVRPQHVRLSREGGGLRGRIVSVEPVSNADGGAAGDTLVAVDVEGFRLRALVPATSDGGSAAAWEVDDRVVVRIRPEHYVVFDDRGVRLDQVPRRS